MFSFVSEMEGEGIFLLRRGEEEGNSLFASKKEEEGRFCFRELRRMFFFCFRDGRGGYLFASERGGRRQFSFCLKEGGGGSMFCFREREEGYSFGC